MSDADLQLPYRHPEEIQAMLAIKKRELDAFDASKQVRKPTQAEFDAAYDRHSEWLSSDKKSGKQMDLQGCDFLGIKMRQRADFREAILNGCVFSSAKLPDANFKQAHLIHAQFKECLLYKADFTGANMKYCQFQKANLEQAKLSIAILDDADFSEAELPSVRMSSVFAQNTSFSHANLQGADLEKARLIECNLDGANLLGAQLPNASLAFSRLVGATLEAAELKHANLRRADLRRASLLDAKFQDADLRDAIGVRLDQTFIRDTRFSPVGNRLLATCVNWIVPVIRKLLMKVRYERFAKRLEFSEKHVDAWSVLRQSYAGPRAFLLFLIVIAFALPYVARAIFWSWVGAAEPAVIRFAEYGIDEGNSAMESLRAYSESVGDARATLESGPANPATKRVADVLQDVNQKLDERIAEMDANLQRSDNYLDSLEPRAVWQVVLQLDRKRWLPTVLAVVLIVYNVCLYFLVTSIGPLRDQEERSGFSPTVAQYRHLRILHIVTCFLFYASLSSFVMNAYGLLTHTVLVPSAS